MYSAKDMKNKIIQTVIRKNRSGITQGVSSGSKNADNGQLVVEDEQERRRIDEALIQLFNEQVNEQSRPSHDEEIIPSNIFNAKVQQGKSLVEQPTPLYKNQPLEIVYQNRIRFANFISSKPSSTSMTVQLSSGQIVAIDFSQVISVWDELSDDKGWPTTPEEWATVTNDALIVLKNLSPRKSHLDEFWTLVATRSSVIPVDSLDLGVYIFQERKFRSWINPYSEASEAKVYLLSAAQRYASALLLFHDNIHFKRSVSKVMWPENAVAKMKEQQEDYDDDDEEETVSTTSELAALYLVEGGYKVLDESIVSFKEMEVLESYYNNRLKSAGEESNEQSQNAFEMSTITRLLRALELYAMSRSKVAPPKVIKSLLKKLKLPLTTESAQSLLIRMGYDSKDYQMRRSSIIAPSPATIKTKTTTIANDSGGIGGINPVNPLPSSSEYILNITPWPTDVITEALQLAREIEDRKTLLMKESVGRVGKRGVAGKVGTFKSL